MEFKEYKSIYFKGKDNRGRYDRTKNVIKSILEIYYGAKINGLRWKVSGFVLDGREYIVDFDVDETHIKLDIKEKT